VGGGRWEACPVRQDRGVLRRGTEWTRRRSGVLRGRTPWGGRGGFLAFFSGGGGRHGIPWGWAEADWGAWIEMQVSEGRYLGSDGFSELEMMGEMGVAWVGE